MKKAFVVFLVLFLSCTITATADEPIYLWKEVIPQKDRITTRWAFVVDSSHSVAQTGLFGGIIEAYRITTAQPQDQLKFCMYAFNNSNCHTYRPWEEASVNAFDDAIRWLYKRANQGTMSYGALAIEAALKQPHKKLSVIIITDGGFTEGGAAIKKVIKRTQKWRVEKGYGKALICTIGIENMLCRPAYPKPTNTICQGWLKEIGSKGNGGYYYVYKRKRKLSKKER